MVKKHKKSRILTYFLSFIPGVGFMYRGWMKKGFSYLTLFLFVLSCLSWLGIDVLRVIPVLIWFYAFFDQINTFSLSEEESKEVEDEAILHSYITRLNLEFFKKNHGLVGGLLMILGGYLLIKNVYFTLILVLPESMQSVLHSLMDYTPQVILSCLILYSGVCFLQGNLRLITLFHKSEERGAFLKQEENLIAQTNVVYYMEKGEFTSKNQEIDAVEKLCVEDVRTERVGAEEAKSEEVRTEEFRAEEFKVETSSAEKSRTEEFKAEELKAEAVRAEELRSEERSFAEILEQVGREQLIRKAKELLEADIYQGIHKESAIASQKNSAVLEGHSDALMSNYTHADKKTQI